MKLALSKLAARHGIAPAQFRHSPLVEPRKAHRSSKACSVTNHVTTIACGSILCIGVPCFRRRLMPRSFRQCPIASPPSRVPRPEGMARVAASHPL